MLGVIECRDGPRLFLERLAALRIGGGAARQDLQRNSASEAGIAGTVHLSMPPHRGARKSHTARAVIRQEAPCLRGQAWTRPNNSLDERDIPAVSRERQNPKERAEPAASLESGRGPLPERFVKVPITCRCIQNCGVVPKPRREPKGRVRSHAPLPEHDFVQPVQRQAQLACRVHLRQRQRREETLRARPRRDGRPAQPPRITRDSLRTGLRRHGCLPT